MQTSYTWNFAISQGMLQQISRHIKTQNISRLTSTIHHNMSCLIKGGNHVPFRPEKYLLHCFSDAKKHTILSAPKRRFQETNHDTLGCPVSDTATTHQGSTENDVNTLRCFYQKRNMFFLHESWTTWVKHQGLQPNPWPKCRGWESSPTLKNTPMMRALRPHIGQGWWGAPHSG